MTQKQLNRILALLLSMPLLILMACSDNQPKQEDSVTEDDGELVLEGTLENESAAEIDESGLCISSEPFNTTLLTDAYGDINAAFYSSLYNRKLSLQDVLSMHYHRVGCSSDTCRQEFNTLAAVQYPKDSIMQHWMAGVLGKFYFDATRGLDILVNGSQTEDSGEGETLLSNMGCRQYEGVLNDQGKSMFDYYQARVWVIGNKREAAVHGPSGRYSCIIYQCWQSHEISSWFVAYSTSETQWPSHYVCSFDRRDGRQLQLSDIVRDDCIAELNDLVIDAARSRHYLLINSKSSEVAVDAEECDYSSAIQINSVGFTADGLAVSTSALPFDQWPKASHILIIPYKLVNPLLQGRYRR